MTTATLSQAADRVKERAARYDPARLALYLLTAIPMAIGWVAAKVCRVLWVIGALLVAALAEGWASGWATEKRRR